MANIFYKKKYMDLKEIVKMNSESITGILEYIFAFHVKELIGL